VRYPRGKRCKHTKRKGEKGIEFDAVELPSQFHGNCRLALAGAAMLTEHPRPWAQLPRALFDRSSGCPQLSSGMHLARQLDFGLFAPEVHATSIPSGPTPPRFQALAREVRSESPPAVGFPPAEPARHSFTTSFQAVYAAGYYSALAEVLSSDCFLPVRGTGDGWTRPRQRFLETILSGRGVARIGSFSVPAARRASRPFCAYGMTGLGAPAARA